MLVFQCSLNIRLSLVELLSFSVPLLFVRTAEVVARFRPRCPIIVITRDASVARQMHLYRACFPLVYDKPPRDNVLEEHDERLDFALDMGKRMGFIKLGNPFVFVSGWKAGAAHTNTIRILTVMEEKIHIAKSLSESADLKGMMQHQWTASATR